MPATPYTQIAPSAQYGSLHFKSADHPAAHTLRRPLAPPAQPDDIEPTVSLMTVSPARIDARVSVEAFDAFVNLPENAETLFEYIGGELTPVPSNAYASKIAARILGFIFVYLLEHDLGHLTGEAGSYRVSGERYVPDVAFISRERQPEIAQEGYNLNPPDLAVEVQFPLSVKTQQRLPIKLANYLAAGTTVWVVYPTDDRKDQRIEVYRPGQPVEVLRTTEETVVGGDNILPGLKISLKDIFQS
jgi:Uma2 family endonuclease